MQTAKAIIEHLGGTEAVAAALGAPYTTVHSWGRKNTIPHWRRGQIIALAKRRRKPLTEADFPQPAQPSEAAA